MVYRIASFLPSATEILYELGVGDQVLAVTHECNYPADARTKPRVIHSSFDPERMTSHEIDDMVVQLLHSGKEIYLLDEEVLRRANPDLIIAQGICEVCSPFRKEVSKALSILENKPQVLVLDPKNLDNILDNVMAIGSKIGKTAEAEELVGKLETRIKRVGERPKGALPRVLCLEWLDPLFTAGHWIPQMVEIAGGKNGLSSVGERSRRADIQEAVIFDPDIIILMPCGFDVNRTIQEYGKLEDDKRWQALRAVKDGEVYAVNANEYFSKPGPRTVAGLEILAKIINPDTFRDVDLPKNSIQKIDLEN